MVVSTTVAEELRESTEMAPGLQAVEYTGRIHEGYSRNCLSRHIVFHVMFFFCGL